MLIKLHVVRYRDGHEDIDEELINTNHIARMAEYNSPDSLAKTYLFFPEQPMWQQIKVTESMDEILYIVEHRKLTKDQFEEFWENGYLKEAVTDDDSGMDNN